MDNIAFPAQSNRASWRFTGQITDFDNSPIDITNCPIVFQISDKDGTSALSASSSNGKITVVGLGIFQWFFTKQEMASLFAGTYETGLTLTSSDGSETIQLGIGPLAIVDGVVSA